MQNIKDTIKQAEKMGVAIGHFNFSTLDQFQAITKAARDLDLPVILGLSESEREFIGLENAVSLIKNARKELKILIFLNADHTYKIEKIREAGEAGFDSVVFDGAGLPLQENIAKTKEAVKVARKINPRILVEAEIGYIGKSSMILKEIPEGALIDEGDLPTPEDAKNFVEQTKVDMLAPAVGNIHGMFKNAPNPDLKIERIRAIKQAVKIPLVLHGGSGIKDSDFKEAINAGISIIHISTEIRSAWRGGVEKAFQKIPNEVAPYKLLTEAENDVGLVVKNRLRLFSGKL